MPADLLLAIDTAGERCSAAILRLPDGALLSRADPVIGRGHAEQLMSVIEAVLGQAGAGWGDLAKLGVGIGPGSFTGIRVGVSAARGLALALQLPVVGVSSLEALAEPHWRGGAVLAVHDAKRGEVYAALHGQDGMELQPPTAMSPDALPGFCAPVGDGSPLVLTGSGTAIAAAELDGRDLIQRPAADASADIAAIARLAAGRTPAAPPSPLYLRGADAKAKAAPSLRAMGEAGDPVRRAPRP